MSQSAIMAALVAKDSAAIRAAIVGEFIPLIPAATDPLTWDPRELGASGGNTFQAVFWNETIWYRDETSVAAADSISVITLADGVNYLTSELGTGWFSVLSRSVETPPDPADVDPAARPAIGDTYLVPGAGLGDWAGHEGDRARWTSRGWSYSPGTVGEVVLVEDEGETGEYIHFNADDEWEDGVPGNLIDLSVTPAALLIRSWDFENQTTTAPPATGPAGEQYVIGASATGAWAGLDKKIAWRPSTNAAFEIVTPFTGEEGYDKSTGGRIKWNGTAWISAAGSIVGYKHVTTLASAAPTVAAGATGTYTYSDATVPTVSGPNLEHYNDAVTLSYTAKSTANKLRITYTASATFGNTDWDPVLALLRDSEASAIKHDRGNRVPNTGNARIQIVLVWVIDIVDLLAHTYTITNFSDPLAGTYRWTAIAHREFQIEEIAL